MEKEKIIRIIRNLSLGDGEVSVVDVDEEGHKNEGFMSEQLDITVTFTQNKQKRLFGKRALTAASVEGYSPELSVTCSKHENRFYGFVVPVLRELASGYGEELPVPGCYLALNEQNSALLVLDDLRDSGYELLISDFEDWSTRSDQVCSILTSLGRLQGWASLLSHRLETSLEEAFSMYTQMDVMQFYHDMIEQNGNKLSSGLKERTLINKQDGELLDEFVEKAYEILDYLDKRPTRFSSLVHGDLWTNNTLFHSNGKVALIDFQSWGFGSVCWDIASLIISSCRAEQITGARDGSLDQYLKAYLEGFELPWRLSCTPLPEQWNVGSLREELLPWLTSGLVWIIGGADILFEVYNQATADRISATVLTVLKNYPVQIK